MAATTAPARKTTYVVHTRNNVYYVLRAVGYDHEPKLFVEYCSTRNATSAEKIRRTLQEADS